MTFDNSRKNLKETTLQEILSAVSAGAIIFLYWQFTSLLHGLSPLANIFLQSIPLALLMGAKFSIKVNFLGDLAEDWRMLSVKVHLLILLAVFLLFLAIKIHFFLKLFLKKKKKAPLMVGMLQSS